MPLLYKYVSSENTTGGTPLPLCVLQTMRLIAANPGSFNDPFEVRPWFDQERHDYAAKTQESLHKNLFGTGYSLIKGRSMVGIPTENASGFGEKYNKLFRDDIGRKFRVLCLSENPKSVLMWGTTHARTLELLSALIRIFLAFIAGCSRTVLRFNTQLIAL
jgi:hypothetical protein